MEGQLAKNPLAELIREIADAELSGAVRLSRKLAKVIICVNDGELIFATSNLRAHRLREVLQRNGFNDDQLKEVLTTGSDADADAAAALLTSGMLTQQSLQKVRAAQASDVIRTALLWTGGQWEFDPRVRISDEARVQIDIDRLLHESARHLPFPFVKSRFKNPNELFSIDTSKEIANLSPIEEFIVSRIRLAPTAVQFPDLVGNGLPEEESLRGAYALSLGGLLRRSDWPTVFDPDTIAKLKSIKPRPESGSPEKITESRDKIFDVDSFLAHIDSAKDHYEALDVSRGASLQQIKDAYHTLARQYHPDRFHQSAPELRSRLESAFARIAQAYELLNDPMRRADYDQRRISKPATVTEKPAAPVDDAVVQPPTSAENSFRQGMDALRRKEHDDAIRFLAEAAILEPKQALYRAHYGYALMNRPKGRRAAETELLAALALEPNNAKFRVMLAEVYQSGGMRRRAESEAARALTIDPRNEKARALIQDLRKR